MAEQASSSPFREGGALEVPVGESRWDAARVDRVLTGVKQTVERGRRRRHAVLGVMAVVAMFAAALPWLRGAPPQAPLVQREAGSLRFLDGSRVDLIGEASTVDVSLVAPSYTELVLAGGAARFDVAPRPERRFAVRAGDTRVEVLGTRFTVERNGASVRVAVERGRVRVIWPGGESQLAAGERGVFPPHGAAAPGAPAALEPASGVEASRPPLPVPSDAARGQASREPPDRAVLRSRFRELARGGDYQKAYGVVRDDPAVVTNSAEDLMLAADSARLSGHPERAPEYLRRITSEHPRDSRAPLAAFTLGRILLTQLGQPAEAERAFALTRKLSPAGPLSGDALAREAEAAERAGHHERARALVEEYGKKYAASQRLDAVRRLGGVEPAKR